jgi:leucyl aminopeptidase
MTSTIQVLKESEYKNFLGKQPPLLEKWLKGIEFKAENGKFAFIPDANGNIDYVLAIIADTPDIWSIGHLPAKLPVGKYAIKSSLGKADLELLYIGWKLGEYQFSTFKTKPKKRAELILPKQVDEEHAHHVISSVYMARDMINTPAEQMTPHEISRLAKQVATECAAKFSDIVGDDLLKHNYPTIHTVGRASINPPRLVELKWGNPKHPKVTLVGKGVCFDSGGINVKPGSAMFLMRKDMAGAAVALATARLIMLAGLPVCLRVFLPCVENSISANSYRPSDIIRTRSGKTVEVGDTDAEGRLILCDALWEADKDKPDLMFDFSTLTGAARVALGAELPALFSKNDKLAHEFAEFARSVKDPTWHMPLWEGYREKLDNKFADISSTGNSPHAGAITAALYLKEFVPNTENWLHADMMAWNETDKPGRPTGAEPMLLRAVFEFVRKRFG